MEVLRISTVVDHLRECHADGPLEVLRISTVVDNYFETHSFLPFGSAKNFYCCRYSKGKAVYRPLEVLRISTVVDHLSMRADDDLWKC